MWRFEARQRPRQARFAIDQELPGQHNLVTRGEAFGDFELAAGFGAELNLSRLELALAQGNDHHVAHAGANHRLAGDDHDLGACFLSERKRCEHAWLQAHFRIRHLDTRFHRSRGWIDFRQDRADPAREDRAWIPGHVRLHRAAWPHERHLCLRNFGVHPYGREIHEAKEGSALRYGHAFSHAEFCDDSGNRRDNYEARVSFPFLLYSPDFGIAHAQKQHSLPGGLSKRLDIS